MDHSSRPEQGEFGAYDIFILVITIFALAVMMIYYIPTGERETSIAYALNSLFSLIFFYDFFRRLKQAQDRGDYFLKRGGWLDLLGSFPNFPILRLFRIWRLWRISLRMHGLSLREIWDRYRASRAESIFWSTVLLTIILLSVSSFLIVRLEDPAPDAQIKTSGEALWWAIVTVTTVGYGDLVPVTDQGRILAAVLITVGIALVSVLTSYFTTSFVIGADSEYEDQLEDVKSGIKKINDRLNRIENKLNKLDNK